MKNIITLAVALAACTTTTDAPREERVFDFSERPLEAMKTTNPGTSAKTQIRYIVGSATPQIAACLAAVPHGGLTLDLHVRFAVEPGVSGAVESVDVVGIAQPAVVDCIRAAIWDVTVPPANETAIWDVHHPILVQAHQ